MIERRLWDFEARRKFHVTKHVKHFNDFIGGHLSNSKQLFLSNYKVNIFVFRKNTLQYGLKSVRYAGAKFWNSISDVIKQSPCLHFSSQT